MYLTLNSITLLAPILATGLALAYLPIKVENKDKLFWSFFHMGVAFLLVLVSAAFKASIAPESMFYHILHYVSIIFTMLIYIVSINFIRFAPTCLDKTFTHVKTVVHILIGLFIVLLCYLIVLIGLERRGVVFDLYIVAGRPTMTLAIFITAYSLYVFRAKWGIYKRGAEVAKTAEEQLHYQKNIAFLNKMIGIAFLFTLTYTIGNVASYFNPNSHRGSAIFVYDYTIVLSVFLGLNAYITYTEHRISLLAQLVGTSLLVLLLVIQLFTYLLFPVMRETYTPSTYINRQIDLIPLAPLNEGSDENQENDEQMRLFNMPLQWKSVAGEPITSGQWYDIGFMFPFMGKEYDQFSVDASGRVLFNHASAPETAAHPYIAPFYINTKISNWFALSHFVYQDIDETIIIWRTETHSQHDPEKIVSATYQLVVRPDGTAAMRYIDISLDYSLWSDLTSVHTGFRVGNGQQRHPDFINPLTSDFPLTFTESIQESRWQMAASHIHPIMMRVLLIYIAGIVAMCFGLLLFFRYNMQRPLTNLLTLVKQVNAGDYSGSAPVWSREDELGILTVSFNDMIRSVRNKNEELEIKVNERTSALEAQKIALAKESEKARAANQAKTAFLASMSHELRTPLSPILGYAELLQAAYQDDHRPEIIYKSGKHLLTLIEDVLETAKIESGTTTITPHDCDLRQLVMQVTDMMQVRVADRPVTLTLHAEPDVPRHVVVDAKRLRQILINLLSNAIKFTDCGTIMLKLRALQMASGRATLRFMVEDTGVGIPANELGAILERYYQTDVGKQRGGVGLGLAISNRILAAFDTELRIDSTIGEGTQAWFDITLPYFDRARSQHKTHKQITGLQPNEITPLILVIDDNAINRQLLHDLLVPIGFDWLEAENSVAGYATAEEHRPHIVICDLFMEQGDGYDFVKRMQHWVGKRPLLIATSASVFPEHYDDALTAGFDLFVPKPINGGQLLDEIGRRLPLAYTIAGEEAHRDRANREMALPTAEQLETLLNAAHSGDFTKLRRHTNALAEQPQLASFTQEVNRYLHTFQLARLAMWLSELLVQAGHSYPES